MLAYLFPGQGSQVVGMGSTLFDIFKDLTHKADDILGYSIKALCLTDPHQQLNQTQFTQPALFTVSTFLYLNKIAEGAPTPDYFAGHSLGEYSALFAANVFDFETGLQLVKKRGQLMQQAENGAMAAIIGLSAQAVETRLIDHGLKAITIANYNTYSQIVISGLKTEMEQAAHIFKSEKGTAFFPLKVSGAFHSLHMSQAQQEFAEFIKDFTFSLPTRPVLANVDARLYHPATTQLNLINQITHAVQWTKIMEYLISQHNTRFEEIGPGQVLKGLLQKIEKGQ